MEEKLRRAFQLAYFILKEVRAALIATREAVSALDVTLVRQDKRVHYLPIHRTKVSLGEWQMLQRLVYVAAEAEERRQEDQGVTEAALLMHFLKHLVYITVCRNSFFVALGLSRLLHNYTTSETALIHELVTQNQGGGRDDAYYRRRKAQLMRELQTRFGALLTVRRGARGEERFQALPDAHGYLAWVRDCLREFTPWETHCNLPAAFDPDTDELPSLSFHGGDPDGEHEVEIRRLHALLHSDCFDRLLAALRLGATAEHLEVPQFQLRDRQPQGPSDSGQPPTPQLSEEDMHSLKESIDQERERRRRFSHAWLRFVVDGVERARWLLAESRSGQIEIAPDDKLIEIFGGRDGEDLRLAAHLLSYDAGDQLRPVAATLTLEGGQQLRLVVEPLPATDGENGGATVAVSYRETAPLRVLGWWWRRLRQRISNIKWPDVPKPALTFMLLALFGAPLGYWFWISGEDEKGYLAGNATPTPQISPAITPTPAISPQPNPTVRPTPRPPAHPPMFRDKVIAMDIRPRAGAPGELLTRSERAAAAGLLEAKKVYLQFSGARHEQVRKYLMRRLPDDNQFSLTDNPDEADVALKVTVAAARRDRITLTAHLADRNGKEIWPLKPGTIRRRYNGPFKKVIVTFSLELAGDLKRLERQK
jgi:hypothetical protein